MNKMLADRSGSLWSVYFQKLHKMDAPLCSYLLTKVLVPASERASAAEAAEFFALLQPESSDAEQRLRQRLAQGEQTPAHRAARVALQVRMDYQEPFENAAPPARDPQ